MMERIAVVGAGIAGLQLARRLQADVSPLVSWSVLSSVSEAPQ